MAKLPASFSRIFISHSTKDNDFGLRLSDDLRQIIGVDDAVWLDASSDLEGGDAYWSEIHEELTTRDVFLIVLSLDAMESERVLRELDMARAEKKRIVPLLYKPCYLRADLRTIQYISFLPPKTYETALSELLTVLQLPPQATVGQSSTTVDVPGRKEQATDEAPEKQEASELRPSPVWRPSL